MLNLAVAGGRVGVSFNRKGVLLQITDEDADQVRVLLNLDDVSMLLNWLKEQAFRHKRWLELAPDDSDARFVWLEYKKVMEEEFPISEVK